MKHRWIAAAVVIAALAGACGGSASAGVRGKDIKQLGESVVPSPFGGLNVTREDVSELLDQNQDRRSFVSAIGLYGLRNGPRLEATLEVSKLVPGKVDKSELRSSIVSQVGGTRVQQFRMGDQVVYRTSARNQSITVWFQPRYMFVLSVRDTYPRARGLLRDALELKP